MFATVIVGVDGLEGGRDAIRLARTLVDPHGVVTFAHVYGGSVLHGGRRSHPDPDGADRDAAIALLQAARDQNGTDARLRCAAATTVGSGLHELAESGGADLLVVGSTARGRLGRVLLGDDTSAALDGSPCAVAIAPAGHARQTPSFMREIGVAYNGSPESEHALTVARRLAERHAARVSAFEALSPAALQSAATGAAGAVETVVADALERLTALGGIEPHAAYGRPSEELALYSASLDLLVVGSRALGPVGRLVHGSTSHALARSARCPLLVVTRPGRAAAPSVVGLDEALV
jgi:nucleotide-binding universal stress UspA family protein